MTSMHKYIPEEKLTEVYRLLLEMRDNCVKNADDKYDDPKREAKYEALNIAMDVMGRSIPQRWISVKEKLPERYEHVLVIERYSEDVVDICVAYRAHSRWMKPESNLIGKITHWMPLPEMPTMKEE